MLRSTSELCHGSETSTRHCRTAGNNKINNSCVCKLASFNCCLEDQKLSCYMQLYLFQDFGMYDSVKYNRINIFITKKYSVLNIVCEHIKVS